MNIYDEHNQRDEFSVTSITQDVTNEYMNNLRIIYTEETNNQFTDKHQNIHESLNQGVSITLYSEQVMEDSFYIKQFKQGVIK